MFQCVIQKTGAILHGTFIPVVCAAPNEPKQVQDESVFERLKESLFPTKYEGVSAPVVNFLSWVQNSLILSAVTGALVHSKNQYVYFMENEIASKYKWHLDAKADITNRMIQGACRGAITWGWKGTILSTTYAFLVNVIPIIRDEHSWPEYIISSMVAGTLGGYLFCDPIALGFEEKKLTGRLTYKQLCMVRGIGCGLVFGVIMAAHSMISNSRSSEWETRKWDQYWKQRLQNKTPTNNKTD